METETKDFVRNDIEHRMRAYVSTVVGSCWFTQSHSNFIFRSSLWAKLTCDNHFKGEGTKQGRVTLPGFMIGRQLCVVSCMFFVARVTSLDIADGEPILRTNSIWSITKNKEHKSSSTKHRSSWCAYCYHCCIYRMVPCRSSIPNLLPIHTTHIHLLTSYVKHSTCRY